MSWKAVKSQSLGSNLQTAILEMYWSYHEPWCDCTGHWNPHTGPQEFAWESKSEQVLLLVKYNNQKGSSGVYQWTLYIEGYRNVQEAATWAFSSFRTNIQHHSGISCGTIVVLLYSFSLSSFLSGFWALSRKNDWDVRNVVNPNYGLK